MLAKILVVLTMATILYALISGGVYLVKDGGKSTRTLNALKWRIGLSFSLFIFLFIAFSVGLIQPHSLL